MNRAYFIGNLVRDPEMRITAQKQTEVCTFTVAVNRKSSVSGNSEADYIPVKALGAKGKSAYDYLGKGSKVAVEGVINTFSYTGKDGVQRNGFEVVASEITFLNSTKTNGSDAVSGSESAYSNSHPGFIDVSDNVEEGELPF